MSRKSHLKRMTDQQLTTYQRGLRMEQAAVLAEIALRNESRKVDLAQPFLPGFAPADFEPPKL